MKMCITSKISVISDDHVRYISLAIFLSIKIIILVFNYCGRCVTLGCICTRHTLTTTVVFQNRRHGLCTCHRFPVNRPTPKQGAQFINNHYDDALVTFFRWKIADSVRWISIFGVFDDRSSEWKTTKSVLHDVS